MIAILVDTNVLVYAHDRSERSKQRRAIDILERITAAANGALSAQVLSEFYNTATRKLSPPLTLEQAEAQLGYFVALWTVFDVTPRVALEAVRGVHDYQFSFWDAQIWAAACLNQVPVVFSEDFNPGDVIEGVRFVNPFAEDFRPEAWGL
ncbi:MAG: PIN domain-containing protein [Chloroflexota bacterium]|nr:PIN domain-containing protein [Chloroflexota bacterium]